MLTLLRLLADGRFHSGEAIGLTLGISRSAVWKQLQLMEAESGLVINKVRGRGYQLATPLALLSLEEIRDAPAGPHWPVFLHESVDSTNAEALRRLDAGSSAPFLIIAERQTGGRGRRGRIWVSPLAQNVYYSLVVRLDRGSRSFEGLSLLVGLAVLNAIRSAGIDGAGLKWPNDVLVGGRKVAGILLELVGDPADICHVVIGVGINVNMRIASSIDQPWTSLLIESGHSVDRNVIISSLNKELGILLGRHASEGFEALRSEWESNHLWQGRKVVLTAGVGKVEGTVLGIDERGALRLSVAGSEQVHSGGELSLRLQDDS